MPALTTIDIKPVEKMICRTRPVTGSLILTKRTCLTKSQWRYANEQS